jgi:hypothetical protein
MRVTVNDNDNDNDDIIRSGEGLGLVDQWRLKANPEPEAAAEDPEFGTVLLSFRYFRADRVMRAALAEEAGDSPDEVALEEANFYVRYLDAKQLGYDLVDAAVLTEQQVRRSGQ